MQTCDPEGEGAVLDLFEAGFQHFAAQVQGVRESVNRAWEVFVSTQVPEMMPPITGMILWK